MLPISVTKYILFHYIETTRFDFGLIILQRLTYHLI